MANVGGSVTTTILGMNNNGALTSGGLYSYCGGVNYGDIGGGISNNISGKGRFTTNAAANTGAIGEGDFVGGSRSGNIGSAVGGQVDTSGLDEANGWQSLATETDYAIKSNIDTSEYTNGRMYYIGANSESGTIKGNIINIVKAGAMSAGGYSGFQGGGGEATEIGGSWSTTFTSDTATGMVGNVSAGQTAANNAADFQIYGNIVNVIRAGCFSTGTGDYYFRGAGYGGYIEGNAYTTVGTEGIVYQNSNNTYSYSNTKNNQGFSTNFDLVGGGGDLSAPNSICIVGDTTLTTVNVLAQWTYGSGFEGVQIGDSFRIHKGGVVDTCEGSGYNMRFHIGDSYAEVWGGQVDWFLTGGAWQDDYIDGNVSVTVYDSITAPVIINASMSGSYSLNADGYVSGNSTVTVYGGDFSGTPRDGAKTGFSTGPQTNGSIYGDAVMTVDLRGNTNGFDVADNDNISGGRRVGAGSTLELGRTSANTIELNIFADKNTSHLLDGLNIYGDAPTDSTGTRSGHITINVNAPGAQFGNLYATNYPNLNSSQLLRNVTINLVSARSINGLSCGNGFGSSTNTLTDTIAAASAAASTPKYAVMNIGPQSENPADDLGEWEDAPANGLPRVISVEGSGINGFTSMTIKKRLLTATAGTVKNGGETAELATHSNYKTTGQLTLYAGEGTDASGLGVGPGITTASTFVAGKLTVVGHGKAYIQSSGIKDQVIFSDVEVAADAVVTWLKEGNVSAGTWAAPQSTWFGVNSGWYVFTVNPDGTGADEMTPINLEGLEQVSRKTYIGDNVLPSGGVTDGYAICIEGKVYEWEVTEGEGMISHNIDNVFIIGSGAPSGTVGAIGTAAKDSPSAQGRLVIPNGVVQTGEIQFTFIPDETAGEWIKGIQIHRSDEFTASAPEESVITVGEQPLLAYNDPDEDRFHIWTVPTSYIESPYSVDIKAQFTSEPELMARSVIITETEAAAITGAEDIIGYNAAQGRPFFGNNITAEMLEEIQAPLVAGEYYRVHPVTYRAGPEENAETVTVNVVVVRDTAAIPEGSLRGKCGDAVIPGASAQRTDRA